MWPPGDAPEGVTASEGDEFQSEHGSEAVLLDEKGRDGVPFGHAADLEPDDRRQQVADAETEDAGRPESGLPVSERRNRRGAPLVHTTPAAGPNFVRIR